MSTAPPAPPVPPPAPPAVKNEVTIVSHSNLFYWWPVWAIGVILGMLSMWYNQHLLAVVPQHSELATGAKVIFKSGKETAGKDVIIMPEGSLPLMDPQDKGSGPAPLKLHVANTASYGVLFATVLLLVIVITNVPLRGMWSVMVITLIVLGAIILSAYELWDRILGVLYLLDIRINAAGYFLISGVLFAIWLITILMFDRNIYIVFTPGQLRVCTEIGGGEKVYDAMGLSLEKQRSDLFRHWILGLGSGDLVVKTSGAQAHHFDLPNVLFIGKKVRLIELMLQERKMVGPRS